MNLQGEKVASIKVINISEESADAIEKMVNATVGFLHKQNTKILDIQITDDNIFFILGEK
ncbi:MAG: hypothetical protein ACE5G9_06600 [Nitrospinales bacterium]